MDSFLKNYITSLSTGESTQISSILQDVLINKSDLNTIIQNLQNFTPFTALTLNEVNSQSIISSSDFVSNVMAIDSSLQDIYTYSNYLSLLLASLNKTLGSQVKALEEDITNLQVRLDNYAFLTADNNSYAYSYLESFHNDNGRASFSWVPTDRASSSFSEAEQAIINPITNSLVLATNITNPYPITPTLIGGNSTAYITSDTGIQNAVSSINSAGWRISIASAQPITSILNGFDEPGAQVILEFSLAQPAYASQIEIIPFSDTPMQLVQVLIYPSNDDNTYTMALPNPIILSAPYTLQIAYQSVSRFRVLLNQITYTRTTTYQNVPEQQYAAIANQPSMKPGVLGGIAQSRRWSYSEFFNLYYKVHAVFPSGSVSRPKSFNISRGNRLSDVLRRTKTRLGPYESWNTTSPQEMAITQLFMQQPGYYKAIFKTGISNYNFLTTNQQSITPQVNGPKPVTGMTNPAPTSIQNGFSYDYDIGLQYVAIGYNAIGDKGVFISVPVPATGSIGQVRLKVVDQNVILSGTDRDSPYVTSTEYSVSNISNPQEEKDWTPIFPINLTNQTLIESERFFPDSSGSGYMRFTADRVQPITLYKNGYKIATTTSNYIYDNSNNVVLGIQLPLGQFTAEDIFTIQYTTSDDFSTITFPNLSDLPVTSISDSQGAGEGFSGTQGRNSITLSQEPYINTSQLTTSTYNPQFGTTPYQPITVILSAGIPAINLTNYIGGSQSALSNFASGYYYIQSGTNIMFNQAITEPFRVYYQYLQSSVRVRVVERVDSQTFASPVVNSFNLKAKLIKPNPISSIGP